MFKKENRDRPEQASHKHSTEGGEQEGILNRDYN